MEPSYGKFLSGVEKTLLSMMSSDFIQVNVVFNPQSLQIILAAALQA